MRKRRRIDLAVAIVVLALAAAAGELSRILTIGTPDDRNATYRDKDRRLVDLSDYEANIKVIGRRLVAIGARVIFPIIIPHLASTHRDCDPMDWPLYNEAARKALKPLTVEIDDLAAATLPNLAAGQRSVNVHFVNVESEKLGDVVARRIGRALGRDPAALPQPAGCLP